MVIKKLSAKYRIGIKKRGFHGIYGIGSILGKEVMLFEPLTYMNLSGESVKGLCTAKLGNREDLLVVTDDFNLELGNIRLRERGSSGGHNGLQSIMDKISAEFPRLRVGVGFDREVEDSVSFVLSSFPRSERAAVAESIQNSVECIETWLSDGIKAAMNRYNKRGSIPL